MAVGEFSEMNEKWIIFVTIYMLIFEFFDSAYIFPFFNVMIFNTDWMYRIDISSYIKSINFAALKGEMDASKC